MLDNYLFLSLRLGKRNAGIKVILFFILFLKLKVFLFKNKKLPFFEESVFLFQKRRFFGSSNRGFILHFKGGLARTFFGWVQYFIPPIVNFFWKNPAKELEIIRNTLKPNGKLFLLPGTY